MLGSDTLYGTASREAKAVPTKQPRNGVHNGLGTVKDKGLAHLPAKLLLLV